MPASYDINAIRRFVEGEAVRVPNGDAAAQDARLHTAADVLTQCEAFLAFLSLKSRRLGDFVMNRELTRQSDECHRALAAIRVLTESVDAVIVKRAVETATKLELLMREIRLINYPHMEGYFEENRTLPTEENALRMTEELRQYVLHMKDKILDPEECSWMRQCLKHVIGAIEVVFSGDPVTSGKLALVKKALEELVTRSEQSWEQAT